MTEPQKAILVEDLRFGYTQEAVIRGISFSIENGEFAGIIGSNGSGKSTLLKLLLGELSPASGRIMLLGENIKTFKRWPQVGYLAQNSTASGGSFPATAEEVVRSNLYSHIGFMRPARREHTQLARQALELVGMQDYARRLIGNLSGGQQQRVMLARVLVSKPRILLLDEPTTGVDAKSADSLFALLKQLNRDTGLTTVMVTHDLARVSAFTQKTLCIEHGLLLAPEHSHHHHT